MGKAQVMLSNLMFSFLAEILYDGQLSASAYVVLFFMILLLVCGFGWCFYCAIRASGSEEEQLPGEE